MWLVDDLKIRRDVDMTLMQPASAPQSYQVVSLNREFYELASTHAEAVEIVEEESVFLQEIAAASDDHEAVPDLLDQRFAEPDDAAALDAGMAGAVAALTATGAMTISSCNGGMLGDHHASAVPNILFACETHLVAAVTEAAATAECGLVNNAGYLEVYADDLRNMNRFARALLGMASSDAYRENEAA